MLSGTLDRDAGFSSVMQACLDRGSQTCRARICSFRGLTTSGLGLHGWHSGSSGTVPRSTVIVVYGCGIVSAAQEAVLAGPSIRNVVGAHCVQCWCNAPEAASRVWAQARGLDAQVDLSLMSRAQPPAF